MFVDMAQQPPAKKLCFVKGKQGKKNEDLARFFEPYGVALRVRCKLCYQEWCASKVQELVNGGTLEADAVQQVLVLSPPEADVPTYARSGTESLKV